MIKTLRITGVFVVVLAGVMLAWVLWPISQMGWGGQGDEQFKKILSEPNAIDRFRRLHGNADEGGKDTTPPLVKQAEQLADIINPKAPPAPPKPATPSRAIQRAVAAISPQTGSAKFSLVGTCCSLSNPAASCAYVRLADNTYQWVQPGDQIAHYVIKEIKSDSVMCWDGSRDNEIPIEPPPDTAGMLTGGEPATPPTSGAEPPVPPETPAYSSVQSAATGQPTLPAMNLSPAARLSEEEKKNLGDLADRLRMLGKDPVNQAAAANRLIEQYKSSRVSAEEAEKLGNLGEELKGRNDSEREELRRQFLKRLSVPRPVEN
jgi:hypothetical protein